MRFVTQRVVPLSLAAAAASVWAVGITVLQPLSEPAGPGAVGENNTYWARELRWGALIALVLVLILQARGTRWAIRAALVAGCAWLAADIALDRIDVDTGSAKLVVGAIGAALLCCAAATAFPGPPQPKVLHTVAAVAAVTSGLATLTESPTDTEPALNPASATVGSLLALIAVAAALQATGFPSRRRTLTALPLTALVTATPWLLRFLFPQPNVGRVLGNLAFTVLLIVTVVALTAPPRQHRHTHWVVAALTTVALPAMFLPLTLLAIILQIGKPFTALAANPPINAADEDVILIILAIPIGLLLDRVLQSFSVPTPADTLHSTS